MNTKKEDKNFSDDLSLVKAAVNGDSSAREAVACIAEPLIRAQTKIFCKRFCSDQYLHAECALFPELRERSGKAPLCDWGNGSYSWMLEYLCLPKSLERFQGKSGAALKTYFFTIINSLPFYERWKDWRFGRRIRVPAYIDLLSPIAGRCFLMLCDRHSPHIISQTIKEPVKRVEETVDLIIIELTKRGKLYLLNRIRHVSLTTLNQDEEGDVKVQKEIPDSSWNPEQEQLKNMVARGWKGLTPVEQIALDALVVEGKEADELLEELVRLDISIKEGVPASDINSQELYYFKRKTLKKLSRLCGF